MKKLLHFAILMVSLGTAQYAHAGAKAPVPAENPILKFKRDNCAVMIERFAPGDGPLHQKELQGNGSGFLIAVAGTSYVVTNAHVPEGQTDLYAFFYHGIAPQKVSVRARDKVLEHALLTFDDKSFKAPCAATLGDSDTLSELDPVYAIGSALNLTTFMVMEGKVSSTHVVTLDISHDPVSGRIREIHLDDIYSSVPLNRGFSGGPLLNAKGEVIGINTNVIYNPAPIAISSSVNLLKRSIPKMLECKEGEEVMHGFLNITLIDEAFVTPLFREEYGLTAKSEKGPVIYEVSALTGALFESLKKDDTILQVGETPILTLKDFYTAMIFDLEPGSTAKVVVGRTKVKDGIPETVRETVEVRVNQFVVQFPH